MKKIVICIFSVALVQYSYGFSLQNKLSAEVNETVKQIIEKSENKTLSLNTECIKQLTWFLENLIFNDDGSWALKLIDASAKIPAGILELNMAWMGNFDECLAIESTKHDVKGKYCLAALLIDTNSLLGAKNSPTALKSDESAGVQMPALPSLGICVPDKCKNVDIQNIFQTIISIVPINVVCQTKDDLHKPLDTGALFTIGFFSVFIFLMVLSTLYDVYRNNKTEPHPLLVAFSIYTNGRRLFTTKKNLGEFSCLHGIKFLSMLWVILGHIFSTMFMGPLTNTAEIFKYLGATKSMIFTNAIHSVDSFFVITGFLIVYGFMKSMHQGYKFNIFVFYLHRYLRLTVAFIPVVLTTLFLIKYLSSGPFYQQIDATLVAPCRNRWWSALLYFQNYNEEMCVEQTWYLNIDWQLYLISPIFLLFLPKYPIIGLSLMLCGTATAMIASFVITWKHQLLSLETNFHQSLAQFSSIYYYKTYTRAATWFIGGFLGYIMGRIKLQNNPTVSKLPKWLVGAIWMIVLTTIPVCIFAGHDTLTSEEYHPYSNALYNSFARPAWGICVAWIIFACSLGYGGPINSFLSLPIFQIISRFTYSIYLLHQSLIYIIIWSQRQPGYFSVFNIALSFWGIFALTFSLSIFWVLAFESPIPILEKYFLGKLITTPKIENGKNPESIGSSTVTLRSNI